MQVCLRSSASQQIWRRLCMQQRIFNPLFSLWNRSYQFIFRILRPYCRTWTSQVTSTVAVVDLKVPNHNRIVWCLADNNSPFPKAMWIFLSRREVANKIDKDCLQFALEQKVTLQKMATSFLPLARSKLDSTCCKLVLESCLSFILARYHIFCLLPWIFFKFAYKLIRRKKCRTYVRFSKREW